MQHHLPQNPNPPPVDLYSHHLYSAHFVSHQHSENPNPNPHPHAPIDPLKTHEPHCGLDQSLRPPGVDHGASVSSLAHSHGAVHEAYHPGVAYDHHQAAAVPPGYYQDPSVVNALQNWAAEVVQYYGSTPLATGVTIPPNGTEHLVHSHRTNAIVQPRGNGIWKRGPKKTKIIQSAWCEVCKIECNSKDVLQKHKMGKKHQKNLEKLKESIAPAPVASRVLANPVIGPQENRDAAAVQKTKKKAAEPVEDLETKKRKILEGGVAAEAVRMCTICNVVCNSQMVFAFHLAGKKHASMIKKHIGGAGVANAT